MSRTTKRPGYLAPLEFPAAPILENVSPTAADARAALGLGSAALAALGGMAPGNAATVLSRFLQTPLDCINQGTSNHAGSGGTAIVNNLRRLTTGANASSRGQLRWVFSMMYGGSGIAVFSRAFAFAVCGVTWNTVSLGSTIARFLYGKTSATLTGNLSAPGVGFVLKGIASNQAEVYGCVHNGTTYAEVLVATVASSTQFKAVAISSVGSVYFWVNGSIQTLSGGPTVDTAGSVDVTAEIENPGDANSRLIDLAGIGIFDI